MTFKRLFRTFPYILFIVLFTAIAPVLLAQTECPALVTRALDAMGENCGGISRNSACYGYNLVGASFVTEVEEDFFTTPADQAPINEIEALTTSALSVDEDRWGVAVMSLQANIPDTLPGQAVTFVLMGDVEVENAVDPGAAFSPADAVAVTSRRIANIRSAGSLTANVIGAVEVGETLQADGVSADREWLRIVYNDVIGWIFRDLVATEADLDSLPVITDATRSPMQAFYLRTGIGQVACEDAPADSLVIQGPERLTVNFTVNGADVTLGSTAAFRILPPGDVMEVTVLDGKVTIGGVEVLQGYKTTLCLSEPEDRGLDGNPNDREVSCGASDPVRLDETEQEGWCSLGDVPESLLNYQIPIECGQGILFPTPIPTPVTPRDTQPQSCAGLQPTSPLSDVPSSATVFYWDGIAAATSYVVVIGDGGGNTLQRIGSGGTNTSVNVSGLVEGSQIAWYVEAYAGDALICTSGAITIPVVGSQDPAPAPPTPFNVIITDCFDLGTIAEMTIEFIGVEPGETILVNYMNNFEEDVTATLTAVAGPQPYILPGTPLSNNMNFLRVATDEHAIVPSPTCFGAGN